MRSEAFLASCQISNGRRLHELEGTRRKTCFICTNLARLHSVQQTHSGDFGCLLSPKLADYDNPCCFHTRPIVMAPTYLLFTKTICVEARQTRLTDVQCAEAEDSRKTQRGDGIGLQVKSK